MRGGALPIKTRQRIARLSTAERAQTVGTAFVCSGPSNISHHIAYGACWARMTKREGRRARGNNFHRRTRMFAAVCACSSCLKNVGDPSLCKLLIIGNGTHNTYRNTRSSPPPPLLPFQSMFGCVLVVAVSLALCAGLLCRNARQVPGLPITPRNFPIQRGRSFEWMWAKS